MKIIKIILLLFIFNLIYANVLASDLKSLISNSNNQMINVWIYFVDKGNINEINEIEKLFHISNKAQIDRRQKVRENIFDFRDIPISESYINSILNDLTITLRTKSNWLNAISVNMPIENIEQAWRSLRDSNPCWRRERPPS